MSQWVDKLRQRPGPNWLGKAPLRLQGHLLEQARRHSRAARKKENRFCQSPNQGREQPVSWHWEGESEGMRRMCLLRRQEDRDSPPWPPVQAARGRSRASPQLLPLGLSPWRPLPGSCRCWAGHSCCFCLPGCPWPSVSFLILTSAFFSPLPATLLKKQKIASAFARERRLAWGSSGFLTKLGSWGPSCLFSRLWLAFSFPQQQSFVSLGLGTMHLQA